MCLEGGGSQCDFECCLDQNARRSYRWYSDISQSQISHNLPRSPLLNIDDTKDLFQMFVSLIDVEVELVSPSEDPITVLTLVLESPREVNGLREGLV